MSSELFEVNANGEAVVNKSWIRNVAQFDALFDNRGGRSKYNKNTLGRKLLAYVYFMIDFDSPIADYAKEERHLEALKYTEIHEKDTQNEKVENALETYERMQLAKCRPLRTFNAARKVLNSLDKYLESINLEEKDDNGSLVYSPDKAISTIKSMNQAHDEVEKLEKRVKEAMASGTGIRGTATMGDREKELSQGRNKEWVETGPPEESSPKMTDLSELIIQDNKDVS